VRHILDLHQLQRHACSRNSRGLMPLSCPLDIEHGEQLRIRPVVRPFAIGWESRHLHSENVAVERQRPVHVFDKRGERASADNSAFAGILPGKNRRDQHNNTEAPENELRK